MFRAFELHQYNSDFQLLVTIGATVPRTDDIEADRRNAMKMIDTQTSARIASSRPAASRRMRSSRRDVARLRKAERLGRSIGRSPSKPSMARSIRRGDDFTDGSSERSLFSTAPDDAL